LREGRLRVERMREGRLKERRGKRGRGKEREREWKGETSVTDRGRNLGSECQKLKLELWPQ
jgi:hypothetical protein